MALTNYLKTIADAIRYAEGSSGTINAQDFADRIRALQGGVTPTAKTLTSISATKTTTTYAIGDTLDTSDITVVAHYSDSTTQNVTSFTVDASSVDMDVEDDYTITVSYTEGGVTKTDSIEISVTDSTIPEGTWQLKTTTPKKYIILGTDDDNQGNIAYFRLLRSYGFPYTMNVCAENMESERSLGNDTDAEYGFTDSDAPSLFPTRTNVTDFSKYLFEHPELGEVSQHGDSGHPLWDSTKLVGDKLDSLYSTYISGGGTKTKTEFKNALKVALADCDVSQGASYVSDCKTTIETLMGHPIYTLGIWGGSSYTLDGVPISLESVSSSDLDWKSLGYYAVANSLYGNYIENKGVYDLWRKASFPSTLDTDIDTIPSGHCAEYFYHAPYSDAGSVKLRECLDILKQKETNGEIEVVTRKQYADLGEWVENPITSIDVNRSAINKGETDNVSDYNVTVTYLDGTTSTPESDVIIDNSNVNVNTVGNYNVTVNYRGHYKTITVSVVSTTNLPDNVKNATDGYYTTITMSDDENHVYCMYWAETSGGLKQKGTKVGGSWNWWTYNASAFETYDSTDGGTTWNLLVSGNCNGTLDSSSSRWFGTSTFTSSAVFTEGDSVHIGA